MKIVVCVRVCPDGELGPFDAAAYEAALGMTGAEVVLLTMGPPSAAEALRRYTRLGAARAVLLADKQFAGSDTLATAYVLSLAVAREAPDLVFCGRQTLIGDTAQTGAMLAAMLDMPLIPDVMAVPSAEGNTVQAVSRRGAVAASMPSLCVFERFAPLRLPSLRSRMSEVEVLDAAALGADAARCGLAGSPTRVLSVSENSAGRRTCRFVPLAALKQLVSEALAAKESELLPTDASGEKLSHIICVGEAPRAYATRVASRVTVVAPTDVEALRTTVLAENPDAVLFGTDTESRVLAATLAAKMGLGLCADCTALAVRGGELVMIRPAQAGSVMAQVKSLTRPALATVRTATQGGSDVVVAAGVGAAHALDRVRALAKALGAELGASRRAVDENMLPYACQVGLTGKVIAPRVYVAVGISGAVHHIVGMARAGTVIAINPDKNAPIFDYADYGILASCEDIDF